MCLGLGQGGLTQRGFRASLLLLLHKLVCFKLSLKKANQHKTQPNKSSKHYPAFLVIISTRHKEKEEAQLNKGLDVTQEDFKQNLQDVLKLQKPELSLTPSVLDPCSCKVFCRSSICCCNSRTRSSLSLLGREHSCYPSEEKTDFPVSCLGDNFSEGLPSRI